MGKFQLIKLETIGRLFVANSIGAALWGMDHLWVFMIPLLGWAILPEFNRKT